MEPIKCLYTEEMEYGYIWSTNDEPYRFADIHTTGKARLENGELVIGRDGLYNLILCTTAPTTASIFVDDYMLATYQSNGLEIQFQLSLLEGQHVKVVVGEHALKLHPYLPPCVIQFRSVNLN